MDTAKIIYVSALQCVYCDSNYFVDLDDGIGFCAKCDTAVIDVREVPR